MFGDIYENLNFERGICMYAVDYLFEKIKQDSVSNNLENNFNVNNNNENLKSTQNNNNNIYKIKVSYLEIYNEQVIDLLSDRVNSEDKGEALMIVEDPNKGIIVPDITEFAVNDSEQILNLIVVANSRRTMGATGLNQFSSRSHAILQINVEVRNKSTDSSTNAKLLLVDLAGSERGFEKGIRREEGANINKSLLALGNCINILSDRSKKGSFVPYRDSKLTRLLKDSLGGNISTIMIACISPAAHSYDETLNTLKYASRARKIQKKVIKNVKDNYANQYREVIENLKSELDQLKDIIKNQNILIRNKAVDSFKEDFINLNLNLNLNINSGEELIIRWLVNITFKIIIIIISNHPHQLQFSKII